MGRLNNAADTNQDRSRRSLRIVQAQLAMSGSVDQMLGEIYGALRFAAAAEADLVVTPELSLTGYHRGIAALVSGSGLARHRSSLDAACARYSVGLVYGFPELVPGGGMLHRTVIIDRNGHQILCHDKLSLTHSERALFTPGARRPVTSISGWNIAVFPCCEVLVPHKQPPGLASIDLILWPSYLRWSGGSEDYRTAVASLAQEAGAWLIQSNWANSVNDHRVSGMGGSCAFSPDGSLIGEAPLDCPSASVICVDSRSPRAEECIG